MEERAYNERTIIVVANIQKTDIGLIVDTVSEVLDIPGKDIEPTSNFGDNSENQYIKAYTKVNENVKIILDTQKLLFWLELEMISEVA